MILLLLSNSIEPILGALSVTAVAVNTKYHIHYKITTDITF
jgi:hypothetical protein